ncbi:MAG: MFS transporter [Christensenellales bacterium]
MNGTKLRIRPELLLYFILIAAVALGNGLSDSIYANYFNEVYHISAMQRGLIEFPRELPGVLCAFVFGALGFLGDIRVAFIAQVFAFSGLIILGLTTPVFSVMLIFLFINSMGMHLFMPLSDAIGMSLAEEGQVGRRLGQYLSMRSAFGFLAGLLVFFGFNTGLLSFSTPVKVVFLIGSAAFLCAIIVSGLLARRINPVKKQRKKMKLVFRKQYRYFYIITILHGVQKQIAFVYGSWVIVNLLSRGADTVALLLIASGFVSIFFLNMLGKWIDRFGIKPMMFLDALTFIGVYIVYGLLVWGISAGVLPKEGWAVFAVYVLYVLDRLSMQIGIVKSIYLRSIAWNEEDVTATLSMGITLDHVVSIIAALIGGFVWVTFGSHWVFFGAAFFSLGNLYVAWRVQPDKEKEIACEMRSKLDAGKTT